jgi:Uma2 family endonuclease
LGDGNRRCFHPSPEPKGYFIGIQTTLPLSKWNGPLPDMDVLDAGLLEAGTKPARIRLVIEVADIILKDDLCDAASRYARHGVGEYWVVDVADRVMHGHLIHLALINGAFSAATQISFAQALAPTSLPLAALTLAELDG